MTRVFGNFVSDRTCWCVAVPENICNMANVCGSASGVLAKPSLFANLWTGFGRLDFKEFY